MSNDSDFLLDDDSLPDISSWRDYLPSSRFVLFTVAAGINGVLYYAIAKSGGDNLENLFDNHSEKFNLSINVISGLASLCYSLFFYKTLVSLTLKPSTLLEGALSLFAPFSASAFLTGGHNGTESLGFSSRVALIVGIILFVLRMINCVDGSVKFPKRIEQLKNAWTSAWALKDKGELIRLIITGLVSTGYSIGSTDSIYSASQTILGWLGVSKDKGSPYSYLSSGLGGIGILPLILYWTHRGLRQLTFGGKKESVTTHDSDPTDRYTFLALVVVLPVTLGILGAETSNDDEAFGRLGLFAEIVKVISAMIYAVCAGTPGVSTLFRETAKKIGNYKKERIFSEKSPLLLNTVLQESMTDSDLLLTGFSLK